MRAPSKAGGTVWRTDVVFGALLFAALAAIYLALPIALLRTHTFATVDVAAQTSSLTRVAEYTAKPHAVLADPTVQFLPWAMFSRDELAAGRWPLWNPYNAGGAPLFANYQSAVLSPFTLPFYVLWLQLALVVAAFAKLFVAGLFGFLFLRASGRSRSAAAVGSIVATYSGFVLLWLQYPHTGVFAVLPAALFFAERAFTSLDGGAHDRTPVGALAGLLVSLACAALAGHPETLLYCALLVLACCAARTVGLARRAWADTSERRHVLARASAVAAACALAVGVAACQLVPFVEYLSRSAAAVTERNGAMALDGRQWSLFAFPNLLGTPADDSSFGYALPAPNYQEFNSFHLGGLALVCALASVAWLRRDSRARFFAVVAAVWVLYAFDVGGVARRLAEHTWLAHVLLLRTQPLWIWPAAALAAFTVDQLASSNERRALTAGCVVLGGGVALVAFRAGAAAHLGEVASALGKSLDALPERVGAHVLIASIAFAAGLLGLAALALVRARAMRAAAWSVLLASTFVASALPFRDYVPCVPNSLCYPRTAALDELRARIGTDRLLVLSNDAPIADVNLVHRLELVTSYDALEIADNAKLVEQCFGGFRKTLFATRKALDLYGVRYVLARSRWLPIDTLDSRAPVAGIGAAPYLAIEADPRLEWSAFDALKRDAPFVLKLRGERAGLTALSLLFLHDAAALACRVHVRLRSDGGNLVAERAFALGELKLLPGNRRELVLEFDPQAASLGQPYELEIAALDDREAARLLRGRALTPAELRAKRARLEAGGASTDPVLSIGGANVGGRLALDLAFAPRDFRWIASIGEHELFRCEASRGPLWTVARAERAATHDEAWKLVQGDGFDPRSSVVIESEAPLARTGNAASTCEVTELTRTPTSWRARTRGAGGAWLVIAQSFFPGWKATLDGRAQPLYRANFALTALELPPGEHDVELAYEPASWRVGLVVTGASSLLAIVWLTWLARKRDKAP